MIELFSAEELKRMNEEARSLARQEYIDSVRRQLVKQATSPQSIEKPQLAESPQSIEKPQEDWIITPLSKPEIQFGEVSIYGLRLRVNREGTQVSCLTDGEWKPKTIHEEKDRNGQRYICVPCPPRTALRTKGDITTLRVGRLVLEAFTPMPKYIEDVLYTKRGPTILFGIIMVKFKDGCRKNANSDNLEWISENDFNLAVKRKLRRYKNLSLT